MEVPTPTTNLTAAIGTIALGGVGTTSLIDWLPKSAIVAICMVAFALVGYFVRRDYQRLGDHMATANNRLASIEAAQRNCITVEGHREGTAGVHRKIDHLFERLEDKVDAIHTRLTIVETKIGMHEDAEEREREKVPG